MYGSSPQVRESRVINSSIDKVWEAIRTCEFKFWKLVDKVEVSGNSSEVGTTRSVFFKDGMKQVFKVVEISELNHSIAYEVIESDPAMSVMSVLHIIKAVHVTHDNSTFVEWRSVFSTDANQEVIQDSRYKKLDGLKDLSEFLSA